MEEHWTRPGPAAADAYRSVCESLLADADSVATEIAEAAMSAYDDPGLLADAALWEENREFNRSDLVQWLTANIQRPGTRVEPYVGPRIAAYIDDLETRGLAPDYVAGWRAALSVGWRRWVAESVRQCPDPEVLVDLLDSSAHSLVQYALDSVAMLRKASLEAAMGHAGSEVLEMIQLIASGAPVTPYLAEERIGYRMERDHLALVLWTDDPDHGGALDHAVSMLRRTVGGRPILVVRASGASRWIWFSGANRPDSSLIEKTVKASAGLRAAVGRPGHGLDGFRTSHQEALAAQALLIRLGADRGFTSYADVELVDSLTKDRQNAQRFVVKTLGMLAGADDTLREALLTYIQCGFTTTRAASELFLHRNTVERRVTRANELSTIKVEDNPVHVAAALLILDLVPEFARPTD